MPILIECGCGKKLKVRDELGGKKVKCPTCGKTTVAPPPEEPTEVIEEIEEIAPAKAAPPAKKKPPLPSKVKKADDDDTEADDDEDDEDDQPEPYWVFPGSEVMAVSSEGIWFATLKGDALKKAEKQLQRGNEPADCLGEKAWLIPWESIQEIYCNKKLKGFSISYYPDGNEMQTKTVKPESAVRDDVFKTLGRILKANWETTTKKHTPLTATILPLGCVAADIVTTGGLAWFSSTIQEGPELVNRLGGAKATRGTGGMYNLLRDLGPLWISVIGAGVAIGLGVWLLLRVISPPIEVRIARKPDKPVEDDDDD